MTLGVTVAKVGTEAVSKLEVGDVGIVVTLVVPVSEWEWTLRRY